MPKFENILTNARRLKALTGLDRAEFEELLPHFKHALEELLENQTMDGYEREGRGYINYRNTPLPTIEDKLLFILTYLKINPIQEVQGQLFDMSQSNVSKWFSLLHDVLNRALAEQNYLPLRKSAELNKVLENASDMAPNKEEEADEPVSRRFFHDGTERPINRPKDADEQRFHYSGKSKQHAVKNVLIVDEEGKIHYLSEMYEGKAHDKRVADESAYQLPAGSVLYQDTGFQGFDLPDVTIMQPKKKPKGGELTPAEKAANRAISAVRIHVEHVIGSVKRFAIVRERIRFACLYIRDQVMETCCGLHNFLLARKSMPFHAS